TNYVNHGNAVAEVEQDTEEFQLVPRGNIFLSRQIREDIDLEAQVDRVDDDPCSNHSIILIYNQSIFHAKVSGHKAKFCVVKYGGANAHEMFRRDLDLHRSVETWHPNILQLFGVNPQIPALIFHDQAIPLDVYTRTCFRGSALALWWVKCRLLNDFLTMKDLPLAGVDGNLEVIKSKGSEIEMTVGTIPNLWVQPATGQLCVMPCSSNIEQPVCSWYVLKAGLDEAGLRVVPPVPLESYYKDEDLSCRIDAETDFFELLAKMGRTCVAAHGTQWPLLDLEPGSVVFMSESGVKHVATLELSGEMSRNMTNKK
ncbi:hypothetical protein V5O48_013452, partial [Marasmius crinis-equi]